MFWGITVLRLLPIILVLMVVRFGSAMAVIDEYMIMGGYRPDRQPTPGRSTCTTRPSAAVAVPWLCCGNRLGRRIHHAHRRRRHVLALPPARLARADARP